jgi:anti-sigma-K factor RskA
MNIADHISQDDLYLFALQLLPEPEMLAVALHLKECPLCRAQVAEVQGDLVNYAFSAEMQAPPSHARERLLSQIAKEKKVVPMQSSEPSIEPVLYPRSARMFQMEAPEKDVRRGMGAMGWVGWAVAAAVAVVAGLQFQQRHLVEQNLNAESAKLEQTTQQAARAEQAMETLTEAGAMQVSLHIPQAPGAPVKLDPEGHAVYVARKASLVFVASHLDPLQPTKTYELWLLPTQPGVKPIPAGLFRPDANGSASVVMPALPAGVTAKGFGVTVENEGGSAVPTAPIVLAGF